MYVSNLSMIMMRRPRNDDDNGNGGDGGIVVECDLAFCFLRRLRE